MFDVNRFFYNKHKSENLYQRSLINMLNFLTYKKDKKNKTIADLLRSCKSCGMLFYLI